MTDTNYNDGKMHGWDGGVCPVDTSTEVKIFTEYGETNKGTAGSFIWEHVDSDDDIIAFRVTKEHKEPREFWVRAEIPTEDNGWSNIQFCCHDEDGAFLVREVIGDGT